MPTVDTNVAELGPGPLLIQNLGDDPLYVLDDADVTVDNGLQVSAGRAVAVGGGDAYFAVSEGSSDVRVLSRGTGVFDADVA
jgi:hypothetical protein